MYEEDPGDEVAGSVEVLDQLGFRFSTPSSFGEGTQEMMISANFVDLS